MVKTEQNLKDAFAGESQANRKYLALPRRPKRMDSEHRSPVPHHRRGRDDPCPRPLGRPGGHQVDGREPAGGYRRRTYEFTQMYPPMLGQATADKHPAKRMFGYAVRAEEVTRALSDGLDAVKQGRISRRPSSTCAPSRYIELGDPPASCPFAGELGEEFIQV